MEGGGFLLSASLMCLDYEDAKEPGGFMEAELIFFLSTLSRSAWRGSNSPQVYQFY